MPSYNPRNTAPRRGEAPKSTRTWFDDKVEDKRLHREPAGFRIKDER